jgi:hypothetical protein
MLGVTMLIAKLDHPVAKKFPTAIFSPKLLISKYKWVHTQTDLGCNFEVLQKKFTRPPWSNPLKKDCWRHEGVDNPKCISLTVKVGTRKWTSLTVMVAGLMGENSDEFWWLELDFYRYQPLLVQFKVAQDMEFGLWIARRGLMDWSIAGPHL